MKPRIILSCLAMLVLASASRASAQGLGTKPQLGIFGGLSSPKGDLRNETKNGWNAGALFKIRIAGPFDMRLDGAYSDLGTRTFNLTTAAVTSKTNVLFGALNGELNLGPDSAQYPGDNSVSPYILAGVGKYRSRFDLTCTGECPLDLSVDRKDSWGFNIGAGTNIPIGPVPAFVDIRYHRFGTRFPGLGQDGTGTLVTASFGVKLR
jgi:hypothetical protein